MCGTAQAVVDRFTNAFEWDRRDGDRWTFIRIGSVEQIEQLRRGLYGIAGCGEGYVALDVAKPD
jgi:hypothetical protein